MNNADSLNLDQNQLVEAWRTTLPTTLHPPDKCEVIADEADPNSLRIHVATAGHTEYSFDFKCTYVDPREVVVDLVDVEKAGQTVDEQTGIIQTLAEDYVRHIHECAQVLHSVTHP